MEKQNRAERRRNKFGGGRATEHGGWPTVRPNPVFTGDAPANDATTGTPDPDQPAATGPAADAATDHVDQTPQG